MDIEREPQDDHTRSGDATHMSSRGFVSPDEDRDGSRDPVRCHTAIQDTAC